MSEIHPSCEATLSQESAIGFTFRLWKSGTSLATRDNSVVQTGV